ncbi:hypothetical protein HMPREF1575_01092 [Gardnerella vaginalis JCP7672]|nr:hypothetical protein HMPREF1575_01092 [Gardnerella vaginalis JCP7672]EPI57825.1 hypothetical protein HMPREF1572_00283 [Gardnerella vaginalis JCP7275]
MSSINKHYSDSYRQFATLFTTFNHILLCFLKVLMHNSQNTLI